MKKTKIQGNICVFGDSIVWGAWDKEKAIKKISKKGIESKYEKKQKYKEIFVYLEIV